MESENAMDKVRYKVKKVKDGLWEVSMEKGNLHKVGVLLHFRRRPRLRA